MWLVLDIGNSAIKGGHIKSGHLVSDFRITAPFSHSTVKDCFHQHLPIEELTRIGIASVVPESLSLVQSVLEEETGLPIETISYRMKMPFTLAYQTPETMGTDRLAAAAAAWLLFGKSEGNEPRPVVALDAGTAVTYEVIDEKGVFCGGTISPGPRLLRDALNYGTAQLPVVPLVLPDTPVGRSTTEALQAGIMYPFLDSVQGMLNRIETTLATPPIVIATGGWGGFLHEHLTSIVHFAPHLVLEGISLLMEMNG